jgi:hypothetical protein
MATAEEFICHGVTYIRSGSCHRCGSCEKLECPHLSWDDEGKAVCNIYEELQNPVFFCKICKTDTNAYFYKNKPSYKVKHAICKTFPNHPFLRVIRDGICGYTFEPKTPEDVIKHQKLVAAWQ